MPRPSKFKKNLRAQASHARSRTSLALASNAQSPTPSHSIPNSESPPSPNTLCTTPSNTLDPVFGEDSGESNDPDSDVQEILENVSCPHLPDTHEGPEEDGYHTDDDLSELEDEELEESLKKQREGEIEQVQATQDMFDTLMRDIDKKEWKKVESNRSMGYGSKSSDRTVRWRRQKEREKKTKDAETRKSSVTQLNFNLSQLLTFVCRESAHMMRNFFNWNSHEQNEPCMEPDSSNEEDPHLIPQINSNEITEAMEANKAMEYDSDTSNDELIDCEEDEPEGWGDEEEEWQSSTDKGDNHDSDLEPKAEDQARRKRQRLNISVLTSRINARENKREILKSALKDIQKDIRSRKMKFLGGSRGLQSYRALAIESYLRLVVCKNYKSIIASQTVAEAFGFAKDWGSRQIRRWVRTWLENRKLPGSDRGCHIKVGSLLDDPAVKAELRTYVRSNKWAMNPEKLRNFTNQLMLPAEAAKYCQNICNDEIPRGLKKYLELELLPRIHMKVGKGISLSTARRWLQHEGFKYTLHKKAIYYVGHDRADVVKDRQERFLPTMEEYRQRLVEYSMEDPTKEVLKPLPPDVRKLVLLAHDESTCTANDGPKASWVLEGEQPILKKGAGRGSHRSDVICSTFGWLENAGVQLEYGKNHDGFWTGEMFIKQVILIFFIYIH